MYTGVARTYGILQVAQEWTTREMWMLVGEGEGTSTHSCVMSGLKRQKNYFLTSANNSTGPTI
ncbi:hypothetical protein J6590_014404 [Homalodisca vitripennis]|nr:hypothetical protein J6590_014404 [Homalodisca vitripennis]